LKCTRKYLLLGQQTWPPIVHRYLVFQKHDLNIKFQRYKLWPTEAKMLEPTMYFFHWFFYVQTGHLFKIFKVIFSLFWVYFSFDLSCNLAIWKVSHFFFNIQIDKVLKSRPKKIFGNKTKTTTWKKPKQKHWIVYKLYGFCCCAYQNKQKIKSEFFFVWLIITLNK
jgi:hypothetical protein